MTDVNTMSQSLGSQLVNLSKIAADASLKPDEKRAQLDGVAAKTLAAIDAEIDTLSVSSGDFAAKIRELITSGDWAKLPPPKQMEQRLDQLKLVMTALQDVKDNIIIDISSVMAIILEAQRKAALAKSDERIADRTTMVASAKAEFDQREKAAKEQLTADLVSAGMQIAGGALAIGSSLNSIKSLSAAAAKNKKSWAETKDLQGAHKEKIEAKKVINDFTMEAKEAESISKRLSARNPARLTSSEKKMLEMADSTIGKFKQWQGKADIATDKIGLHETRIRVRNEKAHELTTKANAWQALWSGVSQSLKGVGEVATAQLKFQSSMSQIEAEKLALNKNLAGSGEQAALDAYQNLRDSLKSALQMIQAIEQALSSSFTSIARMS